MLPPRARQCLKKTKRPPLPGRPFTLLLAIELLDLRVPLRLEEGGNFREGVEDGIRG